MNLCLPQGESLLTFAPQRGNAQIQYNAVRRAGPGLPKPRRSMTLRGRKILISVMVPYS